MASRRVGDLRSGTKRQKDCYRKMSEVRKVLAGRKKGLFWVNMSSFSREVPASILRCRWPLLPFSGGEGKGEDHMADYLSSADWKIPYWLTKSTCLVKVQVAISLSIKTRFGVIGL